MPRRCRHCALLEYEHHDFEEVAPDGCACVRAEWGVFVPDICEAFIRSSDPEDEGTCASCSHRPECHRSAS